MPTGALAKQRRKRSDDLSAVFHSRSGVKSHTTDRVRSSVARSDDVLPDPGRHNPALTGLEHDLAALRRNLLCSETGSRLVSRQLAGRPGNRAAERRAAMISEGVLPSHCASVRLTKRKRPLPSTE